MSGARVPAVAGEKLHKVLARCGLGSRREMERWVAAGRVSVNGSVAGLGDRVGPHDVIRVDGTRLQRGPGQRRTRVLCYHKPVGEVTTRRDPEGRTTVFEHLPLLRDGRWVAVGRLDVTTSGLLLLTNDGELAHRLMHPSSALEREYAVRVLGEVDADTIERLRTGVALSDGVAHFERIRRVGGEGANQWFEVVLREGRNREVRRLWEAVGVRVSRLSRVRYGPVGLRRGLRPGRWEELQASEIAALRSAVTPARGVGTAAPGGAAPGAPVRRASRAKVPVRGARARAPRPARD